jgi:hypothetical protein
LVEFDEKNCKGRKESIESCHYSKKNFLYKKSLATLIAFPSLCPLAKA